MWAPRNIFHIYLFKSYGVPNNKKSISLLNHKMLRLKICGTSQPLKALQWHNNIYSNMEITYTLLQFSSTISQFTLQKMKYFAAIRVILQSSIHQLQYWVPWNAVQAVLSILVCWWTNKLDSILLP